MLNIHIEQGFDRAKFEESIERAFRKICAKGRKRAVEDLFNIWLLHYGLLPYAIPRNKWFAENALSNPLLKIGEVYKRSILDSVIVVHFIPMYNHWRTWSLKYGVFESVFFLILYFTPFSIFESLKITSYRPKAKLLRFSNIYIFVQ